MEVPKCFYRVSVKGLVLDETETRFLLSQEESGTWELPGGGLDWGEDPQDALKREIKEETGIEVISIDETPCYFFTFQNRKDIWLSNVVYRVVLKNLEFSPSEECIDLKFFSPEEVKSLDAFSNVKIFAKMFANK